MKKILSFIILISAIGVGLVLLQEKGKKDMILNVGYPGEWNDLIPTLQHTAYADALLHNQFEPLVIIGQNGTVQAMAAKTWSISDDKKVFTFDIDSSRKFSNGEPLSAQHFKDSWEHSLKISPKSANNSLLDVLYKIEGFEDYKKTGQISGLEVIDKNTLRITFKRPFRMALNHLGGARLSAFIKEGDKYLGTGPYIINELSKRELMLEVNKHFSEPIHFKKVHVQVIKPDDSPKALKEGKIDLYMFAEIGGRFESCSDKNLDCVSGSENRHMSLVLNGKKGRLLSNPNYRKAFQYLFFDSFTINDIPEKERVKSLIDPQIYLPLQAGHIPKDQVNAIIEEGKKYVDEFIEATKKQPLFLAHTEGTTWYREYLEKKGVTLSKKTAEVPGRKLLEMYYQTHEPDVLPMYLSVFNGDPDGIYHAIGKNGAISSPMLHRPGVSSLLEEGRKILDFDDLDPHYKKVSEVVLKEVPFIHVGFLKEMVILRKDRIQVGTNYLSRENGRFTGYSPAGG